MIALDASVLIAHLESTDAHHDRATRLLLAAAEHSFAISPLTLAEVLVGPARAGIIDKVSAAIDELTDDAPVWPAILRTTTRRRLSDCCVLLAAQSVNADVATFDDALAQSAMNLGLGVRT